MNNKITMLVLSAVLIAVALSGSVQEASEIGTPGGVPQPGVMPDATSPVPTSELASSGEPIPPLNQYLDNLISIEIFFSDNVTEPLHVNQTFNLTWVIMPHGNISAEVGLSNLSNLAWGNLQTFVLLDGNTTWKGGLIANKSVKQNLTLKALEPGEWTITATAQPITGKKEESETEPLVSLTPRPIAPILGRWSKTITVIGNDTPNASISTDKLVYEEGEPVKVTVTPMDKIYAWNNAYFTFYRWGDGGWKILPIEPCGAGGILPFQVHDQNGWCIDFILKVDHVDPIVKTWDQRELVRRELGERSEYVYEPAPCGRYKVGYKFYIYASGGERTVETEFEIIERTDKGDQRMNYPDYFETLMTRIKQIFTGF